MTGWGITLPLTGVPLPAHRALVERLPDLGYTGVWTAETAGADAFSPLVLASQWSPRLRLGTAVAPVFTRGPALLAMSAAAVADCAPGRFALGIGASSPGVVQAWNGLAHTRPFARTRDTLRFLRTALAGKPVTEQYPTFTVRGFRLERPPAEPPPILLAALRPRMLQLAAEEADGAITNWLAPTDVPTVRAALGPGPELIAPVFVCVTEDARAARRLGRMMIGSYLTAPAYRAFQDWLGRTEPLAAMHRAWDAGDRWRALLAVPDEVVDALIVHGSPDACRARIRQYTAAGLDTPVLALLPTDDGDPLAQVEALAPDRD
ncbi:LLM class F420-dependent oxidoreductase [Streptomyces sp. NPDC057743]|uniref:LLM class F420-dependent oxidoreductase n=1 Tax=Streptomyces sp. NPDC057743 TaxID=3346236 RepID=UPI0036AF692C